MKTITQNMRFRQALIEYLVLQRLQYVIKSTVSMFTVSKRVMTEHRIANKSHQSHYHHKQHTESELNTLLINLQ